MTSSIRAFNGRSLRPVLALAALATLLLAPPGAAAAERPFGTGLLWRVERSGAPPSHVFGTMHTADRQVVDLPQPVRGAFAAAGSLVLEVVMSNQVRADLAQAMLLPDGRSLEVIAGPRRFARVVDAGARYGMPRDRLARFKPWALTMVFSLPPSELERQAAGAIALDQLLQSRARERGIPMHGLEAIAEQIAVLGDLPEPDQLALLDAALEANPRIESLFETMKQVYLERDLAALHRLADELAGDGDRAVQQLYYQRLIDDRNERMAARLAARLAEGRVFVALGALHLSGPHGVLKLLEDEGYTVTRVY